jgi:hypothetical protein
MLLCGQLEVGIMLDHRLLDFCTSERQTDMIQSLLAGETLGGYAKRNNLAIRNLNRSLSRIKEKANAAGLTGSMDARRFVGEGQRIIGKSTFTKDDEGNPVWIKTKEDRDSESNIKEFIEGLRDEIPRAEPVKLLTKKHDPDLMSTIYIGDAHIGQYSYGAETRHGDFDVAIGTQQIRDAIDYLVAVAPDAETGMLVDVGDSLHADSASNTTFKGTPVDVDTRYHKTLRSLAWVMRYAIDKMLEKFKKVVVVVARGNHNDSSAIAVQLMLEIAYEKIERVTVLPTQGYFHYIQFGKWLIAIHHGDKVKPQQLVGALARDLPQAWGETTHRMWAVGHIHHQTAIEINGCIVRSFGTLAAPDGWHASQGYGSQRVMEMLTYRKSGGMHSNHIYNIEPVNVEPDIKL